MEKLGRYEIVSELGRGGCGVVYRAVDPSIGRTVAIKTILSGGTGDSSKERFRREARSAGSLSHPNIVTIHEFDDSSEVMFIAMEFVEGQTLAERMSQPQLPLPFVMSIIRAAADALDFAHANNIVHRDVKPANFLITKQGHLKITDFGIAKVLGSDTNLTSTGMVVGTVQYMSPEQIGEQAATGRSDQFSLAVIAYEMLTGQRPFQGNSWASVIHSIMANAPPPLSQHREDLGDVATEVLRKALAKDPEARYATCTEFANALERSILGNTVEQRVFWDRASVTQPLPSPGTTETVFIPATLAPTNTKEKPIVPVALTSRPMTAPVPSQSAQPQESVVPQPATRPAWIMPVATALVVAVGLGGWMVMRRSQLQQVPVLPAASTVVSQPSADTSQTPAPTTAPAQSAVETPSPKTSPEPSRGAQAERPSSSPSSLGKQVQATTPAPVQVAQAKAAEPSAPPQQQPTEVKPAPVTSPVETALRAAPPPQSAPKPVETPPPAVATPAPVMPAAAPPPAPPVVRGPDPAQLAAQRRAADLQAASKSIADAVGRYRNAFESRDIDGLKAVWPSLGRNEQTTIQNFFKMVRSVKLQLTPVGEPEITPSGAVASYRRSMNASDDRRALPQQDQTVKITFRKSGDRMVIDAIEAVGR